MAQGGLSVPRAIPLPVASSSRSSYPFAIAGDTDLVDWDSNGG